MRLPVNEAATFGFAVPAARPWQCRSTASSIAEPCGPSWEQRASRSTSSSTCLR